MSTSLALHVLHASAEAPATIVSDDAAIRRLAVRLLRESGFELSVATSRAEASRSAPTPAG